MYVGQKYSSEITREKFDAIIIGSGIGGLSTASLLAKAGMKVLVLERHYTAGGFSHSFQRKGYEWGVGVHYVGRVGEGELLRSVFDYISDSQVKWSRMTDVYDRMIFPDALYDFISGEDRFEENLNQYFPTERRAIRSYLELIAAADKHAQSFFSERALPPWLGLILYPFLSRGFRRYADRTTLDVLNGITQNQKLIGVLTGQYGDYGLVPSESSFAMHAMTARHYLQGAYYPVGGSASIARSIATALEKTGSKILTSAEVEKIIVSDGKVLGVRLQNGDELSARFVISNIGVRNTFSKLVDSSHISAKIREGLKVSKPSMSHVCLYVGIKESAKALGLEQSNLWVFPGYDHDENARTYATNPTTPPPVTYISFPSAKDPSWDSRYPNRTTIEIVGFASYEWFKSWEGTSWQKRGPEYDAFKEKFATTLLEQLYRHVPSVQGRIDHYELSTPLSTKHFSNYSQGEIYGLEHSPMRFQQRWLRPHTPIRNFFLTGQDIVTDGIGAAAFSGIMTASAILRRKVLKDILSV